jgi:hypothetical protein
VCALAASRCRSLGARDGSAVNRFVGWGDRVALLLLVAGFVVAWVVR